MRPDTYAFLRRFLAVTPAQARKILRAHREERRALRQVRRRQRRLNWQRRVQARRRHLAQRRGSP